MGRKAALEQEDRRRIDDRWNRARDHAALRLLLALLLLLGLLLLPLLRLFSLWARLPPDRISANRGVGPKGRQDDCDGQFPLHVADVTTPRLNRK